MASDQQPQQVDAPIPLSFAQQHAYIGSIGSGGAGNLSASMWLTGPLDERALALCLDEIRRRHDIFRTTFRVIDEQLTQIVSMPQPVALPVVDLTALPASERKADAIRIATEANSRPFELANGPLFLATLLRIEREEHLLLLTMHHMVFDGGSIDVLHKELQQLYKAFHERRPAALEPLPVQYGDFAVWQRKHLEEDLKPQLSYWTQQLADLPPLCTFPTDRSRPAIQSSRGATRQLLIVRRLIDRLKAVSQRENVTLFVTILAAFKSLLFRHNGQSDCVVGVPIAARPGKEWEPLIGLFTNTLVLRTSLEGDPQFTELLARVRDTTLGAYAHKDLPIDRIVQDLHVQHDASHTPLFQVMFAFHDVPEVPGSTLEAASVTDRFARPDFDLAPGLTAQPLLVDNGTAQFDLTLYLSETDDGMRVMWEFNIDLFEPAAIDRIARQFLILLEGIAADPNRKLSDLPLLPDADRRQIEVDWNPTGSSEEIGPAFLQLFEAQVERAPDALAVQCGGVRFTFRELNERANWFARRLRGHGVARETLVGVCLPRSAETLAVLLGVWKTGGAFLPLDPDYPPERIAFMVRDSGASLFVTQTRLLAILAPTLASSAPDQAASPQTVCIEALQTAFAAEDTRNLEVTLAGDGLAYVIYTSGSTGRPKGVMITHASVGHYMRAMVRAIGITPDDRYLHTASFSFSSSVRQFAIPLSCGAAVMIASTEELRDPQLLLEMIRLRRVSVVDLVPSFSATCLQVVMSLDTTERAALLDSNVRLMLSASEPLPSTLVEQWRRLFRPGTTFVNMFGQTETAGIVMTYPIPAGGDTAAIVPIGRPIANTQAYVLDASRRLVPIGVCGELYIGGAGIGRGYVNQPDQTAKNFVPSPFGRHSGERLYRTGDTARYRSDGVIEFVGRSDEQIKIRGFRIEPGEVEAVIRAHPAVCECMVSAVAVDIRRQLVAFVALNGSHGADSPSFSASLREFLKRQLPNYMLPQRIVTLDRLPRTLNGKVDRQALFAKLNTRQLPARTATEGASELRIRE